MTPPLASAYDQRERTMTTTTKITSYGPSLSALTPLLAAAYDLRERRHDDDNEDNVVRTHPPFGVGPAASDHV